VARFSPARDASSRSLLLGFESSLCATAPKQRDFSTFAVDVYDSDDFSDRGYISLNSAPNTSAVKKYAKKFKIVATLRWI
jgi:hypothetical protein